MRQGGAGELRRKVERKENGKEKGDKILLVHHFPFFSFLSFSSS